MHKRYGDARQFLTTFTPDLQTFAAREWERAYTGMAPSLATVVAGYSQQTTIVWICIQLENINLFAGVKEKMTIERQKELSHLILTEYAHLKVSELLLFFHRLKCGRYGRFYGSVDALFITSALLQFSTERIQDLTRIREEEAKKSKSPEISPTAITYTEYLALKEQKQSQINKSTNNPE